MLGQDVFISMAILDDEEFWSSRNLRRSCWIESIIVSSSSGIEEVILMIKGFDFPVSRNFSIQVRYRDSGWEEYP